jgi:hypothetical protein
MPSWNRCCDALVQRGESGCKQDGRRTLDMRTLHAATNGNNSSSLMRLFDDNDESPPTAERAVILHKTTADLLLEMEGDLNGRR